MSSPDLSALTVQSQSVRGRLMQRLGGGSAPATPLSRPHTPPRMPLEGGMEAHFLAKLTSERLTATVERITSEQAIPAAVASYLTSQGIETPLALAPGSQLAGLDWQGLATTEQLALDQDAAATWADFAVAETGSLILLSSPQAPLLYNMLPLHHICVVRRSNLLGYSEDLLALLAQDRRALPRSLMFLTGTSGTADIEAKNVRGAHGPRYLHLLYLEDER